MEPFSLAAVVGVSGAAMGALVTRVLFGKSRPVEAPTPVVGPTARERELQSELHHLRSLVGSASYLPVQNGSLAASMDRAREVLSVCLSHKAVDAAALFTTDALLFSSAQEMGSVADTWLGRVVARVNALQPEGGWRRLDVETTTGQRILLLQLQWSQSATVWLALRSRGVPVPEALIATLRYQVEGMSREPRPARESGRVVAPERCPAPVERYLAENPVLSVQVTRNSVPILDLGTADVLQQRTLDRLWTALEQVRNDKDALAPLLLRAETAAGRIQICTFVYAEDGLDIRLRIGASVAQPPPLTRILTLASQLRWTVEHDGGRALATTPTSGVVHE